jgi:hypothetical protein
MRNISYFCTVKSLNIVFRASSIAVICLFLIGITPAKSAEESMDSVEVGLLTCSPHQLIYGYFGHTAIRFHDLKNGDDWTFNYGIFNMRIPFFIPRFVLGLTDYEMGVMPFDVFCKEYSHFGSSVTEQILNLTGEEKQDLYNALAENYRPENREYRYNYFYDNCTTRARDMIERCIMGKIQYNEDHINKTTYRNLVHDCTMIHPWASFGIDLALGVNSDREIGRAKQEFLPARLMQDFSSAVIIDANGKTRPLIMDTRIDIKPGVQVVKSEFPLTPIEVSVIILIITIFISVYEYYKKRQMWVYDGILMLIDGLAGLLITFLLFSEHPTTTINFIFLILNPLPLVFLPHMIKKSIQGKKDSFFKWAILPIILFYLIFVFGIQQYPTAMVILASCLLIRCISRSTLKIETDK